MKRLVLIVALPALLAVVWLGGNGRSSSATAEVVITTDNVEEVRGLVIYRLATVGATKTNEETEFGNGAKSQITFRVPPARLDEALTVLNDAGGTVAKQRVDLDSLTDETDRLAIDIDGLGGCIGDVADRIATKNLDLAGDDVADCQSKLETVTNRISTTPSVASDAILSVEVTQVDRSNPIVFVFVALAALVLGIAAIKLLRSGRDGEIVDVTDGPTDRVMDHLYDRRN